jgi:riboflavin kinase
MVWFFSQPWTQGYCTCPPYCTALCQVPPSYRLQGAPLCASGPVVRGFGRGSRQLGVPTANIDPAAVAQQLGHLPQGVYFGWAQLQAPQGWPAEDGGVYKMVMNIGTRPTVNAGG